MLLSLWFLVLLVGVAAASMGSWTSLELLRWRLDRRLRRVPAGWRLAALRSVGVVLCLTLTIAAGLDGVNRHFAYFPSWGALFGDISPDLRSKPLTAAQLADPLPLSAPLPTHGTVEELQVPGPVSGYPAQPTYVYLPPAYFDGRQPHRRFPVLYLIHGSPGISQDWLRGGYVDRTMDSLLLGHAIEPFIVVLPNVNQGYGRDLECQNVVGGPQAQTYLTRDLPAFVDARYRTVANRLGRAIGGLSTGGYCGINLTFRFPSVFSAAVAHSGTGHPDHNIYTGDLFGGDHQLFLDNSPDAYLTSIDVASPTGVYMDDGAGDNEAIAADQHLYDMMRAKGVTVEWNIVEHEGHTFVAFRKNLTLSLPWVSRWFATHTAPAGQNDLPQPDDSYLPPPSLSDQGIDPAAPAPAPPYYPRGRGRRR